MYNVLKNSHLNCKRNCPHQISLRTDDRTIPTPFSSPKGETGGVEFGLYVCYNSKCSCTNYLNSLTSEKCKSMIPTGTSRDLLATIHILECMCTLQFNIAVPLRMSGKTFWTLHIFFSVAQLLFLRFSLAFMYWDNRLLYIKEEI